MAFTRFATSEPWDTASGPRLNKLGDELQEQINVLNDDRGYLNIKTLPSLSYISEIPKKNGKYGFISNLEAVDFPVNFAWLYCDVTVLDENNVEYKLRTITDAVSREWRGNLTNGVWNGWREIPTTSFLSLQDTFLRNGWSYASQITLKKIDNMVFCRGIITGGIKTQWTVLCQIPDWYRPSYIQGINATVDYGWGTQNSVVGLRIYTDGNIQLGTDISQDNIYFDCSWEV